MNNRQRKYAGFWTRFFAHLIDALVLALPVAAVQAFIVHRMEGVSFSEFVQMNGLLSFETELYSSLATAALAALYFGMMTASKLQGTVGKLALGIRVGGEDGQRIGLFRSLFRYVGYIPSALLVGYGFIMAGVDDRKQGLHDKMVKTYVVHNPNNRRLL